MPEYLNLSVSLQTTNLPDIQSIPSDVKHLRLVGQYLNDISKLADHPLTTLNISYTLITSLPYLPNIHTLSMVGVELDNEQDLTNLPTLVHLKTTKQPKVMLPNLMILTCSVIDDLQQLLINFPNLTEVRFQKFSDNVKVCDDQPDHDIVVIKTKTNRVVFATTSDKEIWDYDDNGMTIDTNKFLQGQIVESTTTFSYESYDSDISSQNNPVEGKELHNTFEYDGVVISLSDDEYDILQNYDSNDDAYNRAKEILIKYRNQHSPTFQKQCDAISEYNNMILTGQLPDQFIPSDRLYMSFAGRCYNLSRDLIKNLNNALLAGSFTDESSLDNLNSIMANDGPINFKHFVFIFKNRVYSNFITNDDFTDSLVDHNERVGWGHTWYPIDVIVQPSNRLNTHINFGINSPHIE